MMRAFAPVALTSMVYSGSRDPVAGWVSEGYGKLRAAPLLNYSAISELPLRTISLLVPVAGSHVEPLHAEVEFRSNQVTRIRAAGRDILITGDTASIERDRESALARESRAGSKEEMPCAP